MIVDPFEQMDKALRDADEALKAPNDCTVIECTYCDRKGIVETLDADLALESAVEVGWKESRRGDFKWHSCPECAKRKSAECLESQGMLCDCPECLKKYGPIHKDLVGTQRHWKRPGYEVTGIRQG